MKIEVKDFYLYEAEHSKTNLKLDFTSRKKHVLIGDNGIGKSTLLNFIYFTLVNGNVPEQYFNHSGFKYTDGINKIVLNEKTNFSKMSDIDKFFEDNPKIIEKYSYVSEDIARAKNTFEFIEKFTVAHGISFKNDLKFSRDDIHIETLEKLKSFKIMENPEAVVSYIDVYSRNKEMRVSTKAQSFDNLIRDFSNVLNNISSTISNYNQETKSTLNVNDIEYFSIHRGLKDVFTKPEQIDNSEITLKQLEKHVAKMEIGKKSIDKIIQDVEKEINSKVSQFKESFLRIVVNSPDVSKVKIIENISGEFKLLYDLAKDSLLDQISKGVDKYEHNIKAYLQLLLDSSKPLSKFARSLNLFVDSLNKLLVNKTVYLDGKNIYVKYKNGSTTPLSYANLSAGEKQLIKLLKTLFLDTRKLIILDEPEISLSIKWQFEIAKILDQVDDKNIILVTHSPYFFSEKDIDEKAIHVIGSKA